MAMQTILMIVNAPPYGSERMLSALRLAATLTAQEHETVEFRLFLMSDAVTASRAGQCLAEASGNLQTMLEELVARGVQICVCRTCAMARGLVDSDLIKGIRIATLPDLSEWTLAADKVISF